MIQIVELLILIAIAIKVFKPDLMSFAPKQQGKRLVLDSCAVIDGRIQDLASGGFLSQQLVVPEFVVHELQLLADGSDAHKRERARFGLDVIKGLQAMTNTIEVVMDHTAVDAKATDDKLVALCINLKAQLYTTDFNLQKVAEIRGVSVLNVNDLAQKLRPVALPGERKTVKILQKGSNSRQGVGYLEDGTMVVIEDGAKYLGKTAEIEVTRNHQTVSGKMLFAELVSVNQPEAKAAPRKKELPKFKPLKRLARPISRPRIN